MSVCVNDARGALVCLGWMYTVCVHECVRFVLTGNFYLKNVTSILSIILKHINEVM